MQLVFQCPVCQRTDIIDVRADTRQVSCTACDWKHEITESDISDDRPSCCLACGNQDVWRQKDFPQGLGLLLVAAGVILSTIAIAKMRPILSIGILLAFAAIDLLLYVFMKDVLVCYRCSARHRKADLDENHPRFNLELAERYRQEEIRLNESEESKPES